MVGSFFAMLSRPKLSLWRTLYFNFYFLPFKQARYLPIYVYGKLNILKCSGTIEIDCPLNQIVRGMIRLNQNVESQGTPGSDMTLSLGCDCKIIFKGKAIIAHNSKILLWGGGVFTIGAGSCLGLGSDVCCSKSIIFHNNVRLGSDIKVYDTNFHYTYKQHDLLVHPCNGAIELGHHCWIGTRSAIMKGVKLPAYTTVASNSVVNKSLTECERTLIGGIPAKLLSNDFSRVFNLNEEWKIYSFFNDNPEALYYQLIDPLNKYD